MFADFGRDGRGQSIVDISPAALPYGTATLEMEEVFTSPEFRCYIRGMLAAHPKLENVVFWGGAAGKFARKVVAEWCGEGGNRQLNLLSTMHGECFVSPSRSHVLTMEAGATFDEIMSLLWKKPCALGEWRFEHKSQVENGIMVHLEHEATLLMLNKGARTRRSSAAGGQCRGGSPLPLPI